MNKLAERMMRARQFQREFDGLKLTLIRPTEADMQRDLGDRDGFVTTDLLNLAKRYVVDWHGVTEADLVTSGSTDPVPFDSELWAAYIEDRLDLWGPIGTAVIDSFTQHRKRREDASKN